MTLRLNGSTSGYVEIDAPATAGSNNITLPSGNGSANQFLKNGSTAGTLGWSSMVETATGVGIGTASPGVTLDVVSESSAAIGLRVRGRSSDNIGVIQFTNNVSSAQTAALTATATSDLLFASGSTERMRITSDGIVKIGTTGSSSSGNPNINSLLVENNTKAANFYTTASSGYSAITVGRGNNGAVIETYYGTSNVGTITVSSTATAYNTTSDYRLKENVVDLDGAITRVKQLAPKQFNFIADVDRTVDGFLAHEVQAVVPEAIVGEKDAVDDEGNPIYQGIDQSKLVPLLTAALQEAVAKIETQDAAIAALEARIAALEVTQ